MRSKRLLTMLLAVAMVVSLFAPAASAVRPGRNTAMNPAAASNTQRTETAQNKPIPTLRDNSGAAPVLEEDRTAGKGSWTSKPVDADSRLPLAQLPDTISELRRAGEYYAQDDKVAAFVVMEQAPLSERYQSRTRVTLADEEKLLSVQNRVIEQIEKTVLGGADLEVRYQFTYLTNSFTIETAFGNLEKIASMDGVKSVFVMPVYTPCTTDGVAVPNTAPSADMTGVSTVWQNMGYTGAGMKIAIIDTGLDLDHPSFAAAPQLTDASMTVEDIDAVLQDLNAYARRSFITADSLYRSAKVPFAFNYCDSNLNADHSGDMQGDHGTHVAGIAAANVTEGTTVAGMAPDAQIIVMKVFGVNGGAYTDDIVAALEDAMILGCDVVNGSLGSPAGFSSTDTEIDLIFERLDGQDIVACFSAGNEGTSSYANMWGTDANRTQNPDNSAIGQPGTYSNILTVASADNKAVMADYILLDTGYQLFYTDSIEAIYAAEGYEEYYGAVTMKSLAGMELEYAFVPGLGYAEDYYDEEGNSRVEGKIAVVDRGEITFSEKVFNAQYAGAIGVIVVDQNYEDVFNFGMSVANEYGEIPYIPSVIVDTDGGIALSEMDPYTLVISEEQALRVDLHGGQMSSFSSWGVTPDLQLEPDITGIGGNVYSTLDGGRYGLMSGTSMSSPQVAGITALVMQHLYTKFPNADTAEIRNMAQALLMSTANPIDVDGIKASPRQQGAGIVNAYSAIKAKAYLTVNGQEPKVSMGDSATGDFRFTFEINNISDEAITYTFASVLQTEEAYAMQITDTEVEYFMAGRDLLLDGTVSFDRDSVTVPAGGKAEVTVSISLSDIDKEYFNTCWENGGYVEGYIYAQAGPDSLNLPFLGFYGDWTDAPLFDTANWYDTSFWLDEYYGIPTGDEYWNTLWTSIEGTDWLPGFNPYSGYITDEYGEIIYDPAKAVLSPNGDRVMDGLTEIYLSLLRSAKYLTISYYADGQLMKQETTTLNSKTMYQSSYGQVVPWIYSWYGMEGIYDFTDANGNYLPSGTEVKIVVDADVDYSHGGDHSLEFTLYMDTLAPELVNVFEEEDEYGNRYLGVEAKDDTALAAAFLMNPSGTQIYGAAYDYEMEATEAGTYIAWFDITGMGTEFQIALGDYGANEGYFNASYEAADGNLPQMDTELLYAYRVYDSLIYSDSMYGWVSMDKPVEGAFAANISAWTDDSLEYTAINAAEYVAGKIFAIDSMGNLLVVTPGLFNRSFLANLGINVLDMTFDDSTDTMYVLGLTEEETTLYALDLVTCELTELAYYGYADYGPWAIADDDNGTIYAVQRYMANIYTLDAANGYAMNPVIADVEGMELEVQLTDSYGNPLSPFYAQSMTYADGKLYWAYYTSGWMGDGSELITINTADWSFFSLPYASVYYTPDGYEVEDYPITELVGLLTLTETDYVLPEATGLTGLTLDQSELLMTTGESILVSAVPTPWYYELKDVTWTTSDPAVATVEDGMVKAVAAGTAVITAESEGIQTSCTVTVVDVDGSFFAYNYFSNDNGFNNMIEVDLGAMNYSILAASPVDFAAADYNGHDGCYYGFNEGGQFWRYDLEDGTATPLGNASSVIPTDMAYDYTTGLMYAATFDDMNGFSTLSVVNLNTGALETVYEGWDGAYMTLACDGEGSLYTITNWGDLIQFTYGFNEETGMEEWIPAYLMSGLGDLTYMQSMCWDYANNVLLWTNPELSVVFWIDPVQGYTLNLGDPSNSGMIEFVGMYTIPETIDELPYVPVESVSVTDITLLVNGTKYPAASVEPFNATNTQITWTSSNEQIVKVNGDGSVTGVAEGSAVITGVLIDGDASFELSYTASVIQGADNVFGYVMSDFATMGTQYWIRMYPEYPGSPDTVGSFDYLVFSEEYVDGKVYAYGYDPMDWEGNIQFFVLDANTYMILEQYDMGIAFPFVYEMTYDYTTGTMYALAGASEDDTDLYLVDMTNGQIQMILKTDPMFLSMAAGDNGLLYAIERSQEDPDFFGEFTDANLYTINPASGTVKLVGSTGMKSNMMASMAYDYDTDSLYWAPFLNGFSYESSLAIVDPATGETLSLGPVGAMGAQISGMYIVSDQVPETDSETLKAIFLSAERKLMAQGETFALSATTIPSAVDSAIEWTSSDENVATVDEYGNVTAVAPGKANITAKLTHNGITKTAVCKISVLDADAAFLSWNVTEGVWSSISRGDYGTVTNLTEAAAEVNVAALAAIGAEVYGYDENNQLFKLDTTTYERTFIGDGLGLEVDEESGYRFLVRDMSYDYTAERMLVLGELQLWNEDWGEYDSLWGGCSVYEADLTTGELTMVANIAEEGNLQTLAVDSKGNVFTYCLTNDHVYQIDLETGMLTTLVSLQTQNVYGEYGASYAMFYDYASGILYLLFTSDGMTQNIHAIDAATGSFETGDYIGQLIEDEWGNVMGSLFAGLVYLDEDAHSCQFVDGVCQICGEQEPSVPVENPFTDVAEGAYFYDSVLWAIENGITQGVAADLFGATQSCTRAQVVTFLWRAAGQPEPLSQENPFTDVSENDYFYKAVLWAAENGITAGMSADRFAPNETCTRGQVVTFLWRAAGKPAPESMENPFTDVDDGMYYRDAVLWAVEQGITFGMSADTFAPNGTCIRAQVVCFLHRAAN